MHPRKSLSTASRIAMTVLVVCFLSANLCAAAVTEAVVYSFQGHQDGRTPTANLVADAAGNLYGTTLFGGVGSLTYGTVFELSPPAAAGGAWTKTTLYAFQGNGDGDYPNGALIFDTLGNVYGTTGGNGTNNGEGSTIFELMPPSTVGGAWTKVTLWNFNGTDGNAPKGKLVMDAAGNLYGTTNQGGSHNDGLVFELIPPAAGGVRWKERILYEFGDFAGDGVWAGADLLLRGGALYGTTQQGGSANQGTVFRLAPNPGFWTETILHSFTGSEGSDPYSGLIADSAGNLYGTATGGGDTVHCTNGCGTIYELSPPAVGGDSWQETTLYSFSGNGAGINPEGKLWRDKTGNLYGTTNGGGLDWGTVFKLRPPATVGGAWTVLVLHSFRGGTSGDGQISSAGLILVNGAFYGTTDFGGAKRSGTVFSLTITP
jgi:uncharacterized repeat protein (TIGR03803 family)